MARDGGLVGLRADRMVDVEAGEVGEGAVVLVRGERVEAVLGPGAPLPEATPTIDLRATVLAGFTTVRDVGTFRAFVDVALRDAVRDGTVLGPRMAVAGAYVTVPGGGGAVTGHAPDIELPLDLRLARPPPRPRSGGGSGRSCTAGPTSSR